MTNIIIILSILLSGGDYLALKIYGMTFRLSQLLFLFYFLYLLLFNKYKIYKEFIKNYIFIVFPHFISLFYTKSFINSLSYFIFVLFNCFVVIIPLINWSSSKKNKNLIYIYIYVFKTVGILTIIQFILGNIGIFIPIFQNDIYRGIFRPSLWFYEPSYLATYFSLYIGIVLVGYLNDQKKYKNDLLFSWFCTALTTSSTGFIAIGISMFFLILFQKSLSSKLKTIFLTFGFGVLIFSIIGLIKIEILEIFLGRLFNQGIQASSGGRIEGSIKALNIFLKFPLFGIGANSYKDLPMNLSKSPVPNVTIEILVNLGFVGFCCFVYFFKYLFNLYKSNKDIVEVKMMWVSLILFLLILQANQNYMRLYMWIHIALYIGVVKKSKSLVNN